MLVVCGALIVSVGDMEAPGIFIIKLKRIEPSPVFVVIADGTGDALSMCRVEDERFLYESVDVYQIGWAPIGDDVRVVLRL